MSPGNDEIVSCIVAPYFDAVRDTFVRFEPEDGLQLERLKKTKFLIDESVHDTPRHFAACRWDGQLILVAPQIVDLEEDYVVAIMAHEFGHAADFAYPGCWVTPVEGDKPAVWIANETGKIARKWRSYWYERNDDQVEAAADSIAYAVTGRQVRYCGKLSVQCFCATGKLRPEGLR